MSLDFAPDQDVFAFLKAQKVASPKQYLRSVLSAIIPARMAAMMEDLSGCQARMAEIADAKITEIAQMMKSMLIHPQGSEGYRTAEVTLGGVDTTQISSKTFECASVSGLYFIGEVLDVTGHLGGHNFQWAWASGWCAGQYV